MSEAQKPAAIEAAAVPPTRASRGYPEPFPARRGRDSAGGGRERKAASPTRSRPSAFAKAARPVSKSPPRAALRAALR